MRREQAKKLYDSITNIRDEYLEEANVMEAKTAEYSGAAARTRGTGEAGRQPAKPKRGRFLRLGWCIPAACLCIAAGAGIWMGQNRSGSDGGNGYSDGFWGSGDCTLLETHREDFTPGLSPEAEAAFADPAFVGAPEVMKIYRTLYNEWFLAEDMTDFSQALTADPLYVVHGAVDYQSGGSDAEAQEGAYGVYTLDENGRARWGMGTSGPGRVNNKVPYGLCSLTYDIIEEDLEGVDYEDYIITESEPLYTVIIWARCAGGEDRFVTYPMCPEFVGVENRRLYTLEELREAFREAYLKDQ